MTAAGRRWQGVALVVATVAACLLLGELAIRLVQPGKSLWRYPNYIQLATQPEPLLAPELLRYDPTLGYAPVPDARGNLGRQPISYSAEGVRNNEERPPAVRTSPVLVVGDSYTEGYGVSDHQTWPAHLERELGERVVNGGVSGYGLDQIELRAEQLAPMFRPRSIILAFIPADIERSALSVIEQVHKPYFMPVGDGLELRNVPVPRTPVDGPAALWRRILGHSSLLDFVMRRLGAFQLWYGADRDAGVDPMLVSCRLMGRFAVLLRQAGAQGLVVALPQHDEWTRPKQGARDRARALEVLACAERAGLNTLDAFEGFVRAGVAAHPDDFYVDWHFNDRGNALADRLIAQALQKRR